MPNALQSAPVPAVKPKRVILEARLTRAQKGLSLWMKSEAMEEIFKIASIPPGMSTPRLAHLSPNEGRPERYYRLNNTSLFNDVTYHSGIKPAPYWASNVPWTLPLFEGANVVATYLQLVGLSDGLTLPIMGVYSPVARRVFMQTIGKIAKWIYENERKAEQLTLRLEAEEEVALDGTT